MPNAAAANSNLGGFQYGGGGLLFQNGGGAQGAGSAAQISGNNQSKLNLNDLKYALMIASTVCIEVTPSTQMQVKQLVEAIDFKNNFTPTRVTELALILRGQKQNVLDSAFRMTFGQCTSVQNSSASFKPQRMLLREHEMERRTVFYTKMTLKNMNLQLKEYNSIVTNNNGPQRRHSKLLEYLRRCRRLSLH